MIKLVLSGCNGRMGQVVTQLAAQAEDLQIVAGFDAVAKTTYDELAYGKTVSGMREDAVNYALQHLGNPYAGGGSSLTEGTDGTGLAKAVYAEFGISLSGNPEEQYNAGKKLAVKKVKPGDLIYYMENEKPVQVMICLSNDKKGHIQVIQASPEAGRILVTDLDWDKTCRARTYEQLNAESTLSDVEVLDLSEWKSVGSCRLTSYCYKCNTPANSAITASGIPATEWHTVAVDSSVIPLGSKVYIEGYGLFVAEDTGVKGKWCDLYVYNNECAVWDMAQVYYQ